MEKEEMIRRLRKFAVYMDNKEPGKEKAELGQYFTGYLECTKELGRLKYINEMIKKENQELKIKYIL